MPSSPPPEGVEGARLTPAPALLSRLVPRLILLLLISPAAHAQYAEYPKREGQSQPLQADRLPEWMTLDLELRGRTESQTAFNNTPQVDRVYELTRVRGGVEVRPLSWLSGYLQFHDEHALGLRSRTSPSTCAKPSTPARPISNFTATPPSSSSVARSSNSGINASSASVTGATPPALGTASISASAARKTTSTSSAPLSSPSAQTRQARRRPHLPWRRRLHNHTHPEHRHRALPPRPHSASRPQPRRHLWQ